MKKKKVALKLNLHKETIARLNNAGKILGGRTLNQPQLTARCNSEGRTDCCC